MLCVSGALCERCTLGERCTVPVHVRRAPYRAVRVPCMRRACVPRVRRACVPGAPLVKNCFQLAKRSRVFVSTTAPFSIGGRFHLVRVRVRVRVGVGVRVRVRV